jgi:hypothetical protein
VHRGSDPEDEDARQSEVRYLLGRVDVDATGKQESLTNYPVRAVFTPDYYPTKEGNNGASGVSERRRKRYSSQQTT